MGLVNELQESAERDDVVTVLRKAKRVSSKLGLSDISEWLTHEQDGYPDGAELPAYRRVRITLCYDTNGFVPAGFGYRKRGIEPLPDLGVGALDVPVGEPINTVAEWVKSLNGKNHVHMTIAPEIADQLRNVLDSNDPGLLNRITFLSRLSDSDLSNIPEQVKNRILDWACKLETAGVTGDGQSFTSQERSAAQHVVFNIYNSTIDQLNNGGTNLKQQPRGEAK
jgi:hypothetical protein